MSSTELNKRNQDFIFQLKKILSKDIETEKLNDVVATATKELIVGQQSGKTARQIFGTPSEYAEDIKDPKAAARRKREREIAQSRRVSKPATVNTRTTKNLFDYSFGVEFMDTSFILFIMFAVMYGISGTFSNGKNVEGAGLATIFLIAVVSGALYTGIVRYITANPYKKNSKKPVLIKLLFMVLTMAAWMLMFAAITIIPKAFNPVLSGIYLILIGATAGIGYYYWRKTTKLPSGFLVIGMLSANASLQYKNKFGAK